MFSLTLAQWEYPLHSHAFFELIFIAEGSGKHLINGFAIPYQKHSCFLVTPEDEHEFVIEKLTRFEYLKFTELLLHERGNPKWEKKILSSLKNINWNGKEIISDHNDRSMVLSILELMRGVYGSNKIMDREILLDLFAALLSVLMRNLIAGQSEKRINLSNADERIQAMLAYIREHLIDKEKTSIHNLALTFNISAGYVSEFFIKHTNETLQHFLLRSKLKIAERLLKQSDFTISQIAAKLGFTDASHFSKAFVNLFGETPGTFKKHVD